MLQIVKDSERKVLINKARFFQKLLPLSSLAIKSSRCFTF